jgi:O-antigen/teichoic acid export membrane protein
MTTAKTTISRTSRHGLLGPLMRVSVANLLFTMMAFITSPIAAHALGPAGRGELAAILVPFAWMPILFNLGLPIYARRAAARDERLGDLVGTLGVASVVLGTVGLLVGIPLAYVLAPDNYLVREFIWIGLLLLPFGLFANIGLGLANGKEAWMRLNIMRVAPSAMTAAAYIALLLTNSLTVSSAAIVVYASAVIGTAPLIGLLRGERPFRFDRKLLRRATSFGRRAWVGDLASTANARLDQLLMIPLVSATQLGLYAVAVNLSVLNGVVIGALTTVIGPSVAKGNLQLIGRSLRVTLLAVTSFSLALATTIPWVLPLVFGQNFRGAVPMCIVLLGASVPGAGAFVLGSALQNAGHPGIPAHGEISALVVTVVGLALLVPPLAGMGAAIVSAVAYTANLGIQAALAHRRLSLPLKELLVVKVEDLSFVVQASLPRLHRQEEA